MSEPLVLRTALGRHDHVAPLRDGRVSSGRIRLVFEDHDPLPSAFRLMVRDGGFDVCEMAVATHLLAHRYGKPLTGLAIPLWSRLPHTNLVCPAGSDLRGPEDLAGRRVGVRAYAQTSGVWVRGVLESEYGVDLDSITWVTMEDAHLAEYDDPPNAVRNRSGSGLRELMLAGELAAIMGERNVSPEGVRPVIPDADSAARRWIDRTGIFPVNHTLVVRTALHEAHPWLAGELAELFAEARRVAADEDGTAPAPAYGIAANGASLQLLLDFAARQRITPRRYEAGEIYLPI